MRVTRWSRTAYECPSCGEWHDESETPIVEVPGWICNACDGFHEGDPPEVERVIATGGAEYVALEHADVVDMWPCPDAAGDDWSGEPVGVSRWRYECGEVGEEGEDERPETGEAWQCGECEEIYADRDEAKECCRD